jgi:hypothetical protein
MKFNTAIIQDFEQEFYDLFDKCHTASYVGIHNIFANGVVKNYNSLDHQERKAIVQLIWQHNISDPMTTTLKITDINTGDKLGYIIGNFFAELNAFVVWYWMLDQHETDNFINDFWNDHNYFIQDVPEQPKFYRYISDTLPVSQFITSLKEKHNVHSDFFMKVFVPRNEILEINHNEQGE